ncbi:HD domain-containing protein [Lacticaseibacillus rhamnosus]|uniref:bis(5'-nucleosyl)-tetraphosphatase (symmetrical) YqeK n=1 Tax=Lacticaseibacillus rhamnosus TaxID=47715 RepID=UPI0008A4029A|nr:bis(5'-nucleosyl)-tetraphosphatase (symmetrical) YqeK [Lacticaseibacillus rhamnosus]OHF13791.1 HD domain-containing protein [Lacticaseibacillus rhamnosus]
MNEHQYPASLTHGLSRKEILNRLRNRLEQPRYEHCLRVEATAIELAKRFDQDVDRAGLAGLLHDYGKEISVETYKRVIIEDGFDPKLLQYGRGVWHGVVGIHFIQTEVGIADKQVLTAIARHTTGDPEMTKLDECVFVGDFIEPQRSLPVEAKARKAAETNLEEASRIELENTLTYLIGARQLVYPKTLLTYNAFLSKE